MAVLVVVWEPVGGNMSKLWLTLMVDHAKRINCPYVCASWDCFDNSDMESCTGDCSMLRCNKQCLTFVVDHADGSHCPYACA
eukprot:10111896-Ditylum_brightwellii.AAC.1